MTLTIDLTPAEEARLNAVADREDLEPSEAARKVLASGLAPEPEEAFVAFEGRVERVADGVASLSLIDSEGVRSFASYNAGSLALAGIAEGSQFTCRVTLNGGRAELTFRPVRRERLADDDLARLWQRIDSVLDDYDPTDDD